jgi:hypothetical protein
MFLKTTTAFNTKNKTSNTSETSVVTLGIRFGDPLNATLAEAIDVTSLSQNRIHPFDYDRFKSAK